MSTPPATAPGRDASPASPGLLTVRQAAHLTGVSERTLRAWAAGGRLPVVRFSRRCLRIRREALAEFVTAHTRGGA